MNSVKDALYKAIKAFADIPDDQISTFFEIGKIRQYHINDYFINYEEVPKKFGFVFSGLFRYVYYDQTGKEFTKGFMPEQRFIASYSSMIQEKKSLFFIQALEDSVVFELNYESWNSLKKDNPCWDKFLIALLEKGFCVKEKREREFLLLDAKSRYLIFLEEFPDLEKRVKQHIIASYLGITPVALSRLRKKVERINIG